MNLAELDGLLPAEVGDALTSWAQRTSGDILEIGSYKGKSACYLAAGAVPDRTVFAVDVWDAGPVPAQRRFGFDRAFTAWQHQVTAAGFADRIVPIKGYSTEVAATWTDRLGLVYIDGDHSFEAALADLRAWSPHCDGPILVDDYGTRSNPGVARAVHQFCRETGRNHHVEVTRLAVIE